jgi:hypothetical protein
MDVRREKSGINMLSGVNGELYSTSALNIQHSHSSYINNYKPNDKEKDFQILYIPPKAPVQSGKLSRLTFLGSLFSSGSPKSAATADVSMSPKGGKGMSPCGIDGDKRKMTSLMKMGLDFSQVRAKAIDEPNVDGNEQIMVHMTNIFIPLFVRDGRSVRTPRMFART